MERERLAENLLTFVPLMFKRFMKGFTISGITKQQLELLFIISSKDGRPMGYYSEKMMISKPNLTVIADRLIKEGLIERAFDPKDRRVIILKITTKGEKYLEEHKKKVREEMVNKLKLFDENDVKKLNKLIEEMKEIFDKNLVK